MNKLAVSVITILLSVALIEAFPRATRIANCQSAFGCSQSYFADMEVVETVSRRKLTISEMMDLVDKLPNIKRVSVRCDPPRIFDKERLAYPQYRGDFILTKAQWIELQEYCRCKLEEGDAAKEVKAHWVSIVAGTPPFGLQVSDK